MKRRPLRFVVLALLLGCASAGPRFPQNVSASFARAEMRRMETPNLVVYYPATERSVADRLVQRLEQCITDLERLPVVQRERGKALVFITPSDFNNAYVAPQLFGVPQRMVLTPHFTMEMFNWLGLGVAQADDVSCHEAVHYVHLLQTEGLWRYINLVMGPVFDPNLFIDAWFIEGLAVYYEGRLRERIGRPNSAFWKGMLESGIAVEGGRLDASALSPFDRRLAPFSGHYLTGSHFVEYLAQTYGEEKLWEVVQEQGSSIFPMFGVTLRFRRVYGKSIGALMDDYAESISSTFHPRVRPSEQSVLFQNAGHVARLAASPSDGAVAVIGERRDDVTRLEVLERDGTVRFSRRLAEVLPGRSYILADPWLSSGMSFTADGRSLFVVFSDLEVEGGFTQVLWQFDARTGKQVKSWDGIVGFGGSVSADGRFYVFIALDGDTANVVLLDLQTGARERLTGFTGRSSLGAPALSPGGKRIAFPKWVGQTFELFLREQDGSLVQLTRDGHFTYAPRWIDDEHLVVMREREGRIQAHVLDVASGAIEPVTDAPYLVLDPAPRAKGELVFLNRDGWTFSVDSVRYELPSRAEMTGPPGDAGPSEPAFEPAPAAPVVDVERDEPYSPLDHLFVPSYHGFYAIPFFSPPANRPQLMGGVSLGGEDRLAFHTWALNAQLETLSRSGFASVGYGTSLLAPWFLQATAGYARSASRVHELGATVGVARSFWTTPLFFGLRGTQRTDPPSPSAASSRVRLIGPQIGTGYAAYESSLYGGLQRGIDLSLSGGFYGRAFGSTTDVLDVGVGMGVVVPAPVGLGAVGFSLRGRSVDPAPAPLLYVGGAQGGFTFSRPRREPSPSIGLVLPSGYSFSEPLRGYEDRAFLVRAAVLAGVQVTQPFIIDEGWASFLYVLPPLFLRQVDVDLFADGAWTSDPEGVHRAIGGAVSLQTGLGAGIFRVFVQYAYRLDDGARHLFLAGLSL